MLAQCALALLARGMPVTKDNLLQMCQQIGYDPDASELLALVLLCSTLEKNKPSVREQPVSSLPCSQANEAGNTGPAGRYVYGVAEASRTNGVRLVGVEGRLVRFIEQGALAAVVHDCDPSPYSSNDEETVSAWVEAHNRVLSACLDVMGSVIPHAFNTIFHDSKGIKQPDQVVRDWLRAEEASLRDLLRKLDGQAEYGVRITLNASQGMSQVVAEDEEIARLSAEVSTKQAGTAYMLRQRLERLTKQRLEATVSESAENLLSELRKLCSDIREEKARQNDEGKITVVNLSCLATHEGSCAVGELLDRVSQWPGYEVRFTGPWPAYSFVNRGDQSDGANLPYARHAS